MIALVGAAAAAAGQQPIFRSGARTKPDRGLKKLAEEIGNGYFELEKTADLAQTFTRELRGQRGSADNRQAIGEKS